ncbi:MAG: AmmeMemoRadiSam system protein B [Proteobacteria bacterium]|nr:AmmeMemoRadiSam system protein B [Pseudomonadota bacterium]
MTILQFGIPLVALSLGVVTTGMAGKDGGGEVRSPAVAGQFYPESATVLKLAVEKFMEDALPPQVKKPVAIVVPHAGYIYSGQICADGWNQVRGGAYDVVVILGTNHTVPSLRKIALYPGGGFRTPLGTAMVDGDLTAALLAASPDCALDKGPHVREHSLEVQVPFVQVLFPQAKIVAAIVGEADAALCTRFGTALASVLKGRRAVIVASSDLSHYPSAKDAEDADMKTLEAVATLDPAAFHSAVRTQMARRIPNLSTCACGEAPIMAAMAAAKAMGATGGKVVSYAHSGNLPIGERERVVGYGAVVLAADPKKEAAAVRPAAATDGTIGPADRKYLLRLARETISRYLTIKMVPLPRLSSPILREPRGVFVTLKKRGDLRGCIGRMVPDRPLAELVGAMALQSAFEDPRFSPVTLRELPDLEIEISVLTPMKPVSGPNDIVVGRDGVLLQKGGRSAVFLPQVAPEQGWGRDEMLNHLSRKAGLPSGAWRDGATFLTFQAIVFSEAEHR